MAQKSATVQKPVVSPDDTSAAEPEPEKINAPAATDTTGSKDRFSDYTPTKIDLLNRKKEITLDPDEQVIREYARLEQPPITEQDLADKPQEPEPSVSTPEFRKVDGFRVQVIATGNSKEAETLKEQLKQKLQLPVYVVFEAPLFKVHIGDFAEKARAEKTVEDVKRLGMQAWIVDTKIWIRDR